MKRLFSFFAVTVLAVFSLASCKKAEIHVKSVSLTETVELTVGDQFLLDVTISPKNATNKKISWSSSKESVATVSADGVVEAISVGSAYVFATSEDSGVKAKCEVTVKPAYKAVDLGLSVKWASFNLGASVMEEAGLFYQWGDTQGYGSDPTDGKYFDWMDSKGNVSYKWCNGSGTTLTKYNTDSSYGTVDNKAVLDLEDDAASAALGGNWRMPTYDEWSELSNTKNCSWTWATINGVNGYKVQSKRAGFTDRFIFLPAGGSRDRDHMSNVGSSGGYWSSSLFTGLPVGPNTARCVFFNSSSVSVGRSMRYCAMFIRPVCE